LQDTSAVAFIRQLYNKLPSGSRLGDAALGTLTRINTKESLRTFTGLMVSNPPYKQDNTLAWEMFYPLVDSTDNVPVMYPQVLQLLKNEKYKSSIYWLTAKASHKKVIGLAEYSPLKPQLYADAQALLSSRKGSPKAGYDEDEFLLTQMIELLGSFSQEAEAVRLLHALADDRNPAVAMEASLVLLKKNIAVPAKNLEKIAAQPITRTNLYQNLKELNKEKLFPARYKKQALFAESELVSVLTEEEESAPEKIELVKKEEVTYRGKKGIVYLFKYSSHDEEGKRTWYTGMSGLYENKDALFSDGSLTWPSYEEFNPKEIDKHIQKFLPEAEEE
jgi:hypothetical protein